MGRAAALPFLLTGALAHIQRCAVARKANLTIRVDPAVLERLRLSAIRQQTTVTELLLRSWLRPGAGQDKRYEPENAI